MRGKKSVASGFRDVDRAAHPEAFVKYLDAVTGVEAAQAYKRRSYGLLHLRPGHHVLDVGCGTGDDVRAMAERVHPNGRAIGIDNSEVMIAEAKNRSTGIDLPVEFRVAAASKLPFEDGSFDATRSERLFQHLDDPNPALDEMIRVTRSGRRVSVLDPDWETVVIDSPDRSVTRKILSASLDTHVNPRSGWQLSHSFTRRGFAKLRFCL